MFASFSITWIFLSILLVTLLAIFTGIGFGAFYRNRYGDGDSPSSIIGATFGLLAFMLAFTFNMAANRFDERKALYIDEINAIDTTFLRATFLPDPYPREVRSLLLNYVQLRTELLRDNNLLTSAISSSEAIQDQIWEIVERVLSEPDYSVTYNLFIESVNNMIDIQSDRVTVYQYFRIPTTIWIVLYAVTLFGMLAVGFQAGLTNSRHLFVNGLLALAFTSVLSLITDLDRASEGSLRVASEPLLLLEEKLTARSLIP